MGWDAVDAVAHVTNGLLRTAKSCGPDAPTLASSFVDAIREATVARKPVTGEGSKETVKTIA